MPAPGRAAARRASAGMLGPAVGVILSIVGAIVSLRTGRGIYAERVRPGTPRSSGNPIEETSDAVPHRRPAGGDPHDQSGAARRDAESRAGVSRARGRHRAAGRCDPDRSRAGPRHDSRAALRGHRRRSRRSGVARRIEDARRVRDPRRVRRAAGERLERRDRCIRRGEPARRQARPSRRRPLFRHARVEPAADLRHLLVEAADRRAPVARAHAGARVPEPAVACAKRGARAFRPGARAGLCGPHSPPAAGLVVARAVAARRRRLRRALARAELPARVSARAGRRLARIRSVRRGVPARRRGDSVTRRLLDVPHVPGLDRAHAARAGRRHAATDPGGERDGVRRAARAAGRRARRRPVRRAAAARAGGVAGVARAAARRARADSADGAGRRGVLARRCRARGRGCASRNRLQQRDVHRVGAGVREERRIPEASTAELPARRESAGFSGGPHRARFHRTRAGGRSARAGARADGLRAGNRGRGAGAADMRGGRRPLRAVCRRGAPACAR